MQENNYQKKKQMLQDTLAKIIKKHRLEKNKSVSLLSNEIGMTKSLWCVFEKGLKDPQLTTIWRICEALELPFSSVILELEQALGPDFLLSD